jgi:hypothetical protein
MQKINNNEQIDNYVNQSQPQNSSLILAIHHSSAVTQIIFIVTVKLSTKLNDNKTGPYQMCSVMLMCLLQDSSEKVGECQNLFLVLFLCKKVYAKYSLI